MKLLPAVFIASVLNCVAASYSNGDNYSTLTPSNGYLESATLNFQQTFGIAINPVVSSVVLSSVTTQPDGLVVTKSVEPTSTTQESLSHAQMITQIGDGQIQAVATTYSSINVVTQIGDGQIQATTLRTVTLNSDSPQQTSLSSSSSLSSSADDDVTTVVVTSVTRSYVIKLYTGSPKSSSSEDATTTYTVTPTVTAVETITTPTLPTLAATTVVEKRDLLQKRSSLPETCSSSTALKVTLQDSVLYDSHGRIGAIVSNRQFQFDGPPPQSGSIYAAGWNIVNGKLALGSQTTFYQCLSGDFYNIYDENIAQQCTAVELDVVVFEDC